MYPSDVYVTVNGVRRSVAWLAENAETATYVRVINCPGITALPELPAAKIVWIENCPGLGALPDLPAATDVRVVDCPQVTIDAGVDSRDYQFTGFKLGSVWRVQAGCRFLTLDQARAHWGPGAERHRPDCAALVEKIAEEAQKRDGGMA